MICFAPQVSSSAYQRCLCRHLPLSKHSSRYAGTKNRIVTYSSGTQHVSQISARTVELPDSMPIGAVIGKRGKNIKFLARRSEAELKPSSSGREVIITAASGAVHMAEGLLRRQIEAFLTSGGAYPHPLKVIYILNPSYGDESTNKVTFARHQDNVPEATGSGRKKCVYYRLQPAVPLAKTSLWAQHNSNNIDSVEPGNMTPAVDSMQLGPDWSTSSSLVTPLSDNGVPMLFHSQALGAVQQVVDSAVMAMNHKPTFDKFEFRINFGKCLWFSKPYVARSPLCEGLTWSIEKMRSKRVPEDLKTIFTNAVPHHPIIRLQQWLIEQGFEQVEVTERVSVHLIQREANTNHTLSFDKHSSGDLELRKISTAYSKLCFLTVLNGQDETDWRGKLMAKYHIKQGTDVHDELSQVAATAHISSESGRIWIPDLKMREMTIDRERHKTETVYMGAYPADSVLDNTDSTCGSTTSSSSTSTTSAPSRCMQIKVTIIKIADPRDTSYEVVVRSPQFNELLAAGLPARGLGACDRRELRRLICGVMQFADAAVAAVR